MPISFESKHRKQRDERELKTLQNRYGDDLVAILSKRANDSELEQRDRKHWQRLYRKAKALN